MRRLPRWATYLLFVVAALSPLAVGLLTGDHELVKRLADTPVVAGLVVFLVKMLLDANEKAQARAEQRHQEEQAQAQQRHDAERTQMVRQLEHAFAFGSSSHMANVAFDKHVQFCEASAAELRKTMNTLLNYATTAQALTHANELARLRQQEALWLTPEMETPLAQIEKALRRIGVVHHQATNDKGLPNEQRIKMLEDIQNLFANVLGEKLMGLFLDGEQYNEELAISNVIRWLGRILGVDDLTRLRVKILQRAASSTVEWDSSDRSKRTGRRKGG